MTDNTLSKTDLAADINLVATFLSGGAQVTDLKDTQPVDCIICCVSQILYQLETLFTALSSNPNLTKLLILVGGQGHSTQAIHDALANHPKWYTAAYFAEGLSEARVAETIMRTFYDIEESSAEGLKVLLEDQSTSCGGNAIETQKLLLENDIPVPKRCLLIQDPTMTKRTMASFEKVFAEGAEGAHPGFLACPMFVPRMQVVKDESKEELEYDVPDIRPRGLWPKDRFYGLLLGEIPRLRDDGEGYGPNGKGYIAHVDIPDDVEAARNRLSAANLKSSR